MIVEIDLETLSNADLVVIGRTLSGAFEHENASESHRKGAALFQTIAEAIATEAETRVLALQACREGVTYQPTAERRLVRLEIGDSMTLFELEACGRVVQRLIAALEGMEGRQAGSLRLWRQIELDLREECARRLQAHFGKASKADLN